MNEMFREKEKKESAVTCIENEILRYEKCVHYKGIINHGEYIDGMIDLAARLELLTRSDTVLLRDKSISTKMRLLKKYKPIKNPRHEGQNLQFQRV